MDTNLDKVKYLLTKYPDTDSNSILLILLYWIGCDGIAIPPDIFQQILDKATLPDTITRMYRIAAKQHRAKEELKREIEKLAMEVIKIKINKNSGNATILTENFVGKACEIATQELEVQLGKVINSERTADYYKPEPPINAWVTGT